MHDGLHRRGRIWHFYWKGPEGRRREISTRTKDFQQARGIRGRHLIELQQAHFPSQDDRLLFPEAARLWIEHANLSTRAENTVRFRRSKLAILSKFFGAMRLREITPAQIRRFQTQRARVVANSTLNGEWWVLRAILRRFGAWTQAHIQNCRRLPVQQKLKQRALSAEEFQSLLACAQKSRSRELPHVIMLAGHTGLRSGEIKGLRLSDINLDAQPRARLAVQRATTKTNAGERLVILDESALRALQPLLRIAHGRGSRRPEHFLFPRRIKHGRGWNPYRSQVSWASAWRSVRRAAGLPELRFHDLRHTYITMGAEAGVPVDVIKRQVGHVSPKQTEQYIQIGDRAQAQAVETIEKYLDQRLVSAKPGPGRPESPDTNQPSEVAGPETQQAATSSTG